MGEFLGGLAVVAQSVAEWGTHRPGYLQRLAVELPNVKHVRKLRRWLRKHVARPAVVDVVRYGLRFRCHVADNSTEADLVYDHGRWNSEGLDLIRSHLPAGGTFVDAGANCGLYSVVAAQHVGPSGRVLAIEANPVLVERIRFNAASNGLRVEVAACAVSDVAGRVELQICAEELGRSGLTVVEEGPRVSVEARPLARILADHGVEHVDAMKIDIEGHEDRALIPFLEEAPRALWPRVILMEVAYAHAWRRGAVLALQDAGYRVAWRSQADFLLVRSATRDQAML
jgi:FkbM family methyltransferase